MKFCTALMLIASAGYLATVLSFPLIDKSGGNGFNDGYINITTNNAPTHGFAKRQNEQALALIMSLLDVTADKLDAEGVPRSRFTQDFVSIMRGNNPHYNYVICHVNHDYTFKGQQGVDWDHDKVQMITHTDHIKFDVVIGGEGIFTRHGNGGYINWAYNGSVASTKAIGGDMTVYFNAP